MSYAQFVTQRRLRRGMVNPDILFRYVNGQNLLTLEGSAFARASTGLHYVGGLFQDTSVNVLRDNDMMWGQPGALLEPATTNSALGSSDFSITTYWTNNGSNLTITGGY